MRGRGRVDAVGRTEKEGIYEGESEIVSVIGAFSRPNGICLMQDSDSTQHGVTGDGRPWTERGSRTVCCRNENQSMMTLMAAISSTERHLD